MTTKQRPSGQILVVFAGGLVALVALAALAIDVSMVYSMQRMERSTADAAALAGAQDLQVPGSRTVTTAAYTTARADALQNLVSKLGGTSTPACPPDTNGNIADCQIPGTPYLVSIKTWTPTWSPTTVNVDPAHAVQVTVRQPSVPLTFARIFGQTGWDVAQTSLAGLGFGRSYAIETLRPPKKTGSTFAVNDIELDGGTVVNVSHGDVGTNANMDYSGTSSGTIMNIDPGYGMYYFDTHFTPEWYPAAPKPPAQIVKQIPTLIADPNYTYPAMRGSLGTAPCASGPANCAPTFTDARESTCASGTNPACTRADLDPATCGAEVTYLQTSVYSSFMATQSLSNTYCYKPGIYDPSNPSKSLSVGSGDVVLLMPGAYYFKSPNGGLSVNGRLLGGYRPSAAGVVLMFDECLNQCTLNANTALTIALNVGTKYPPGTAGTAATAAIDWDNKPVQTSGPSSPTPPLMMTLMVTKDSSCFVPTSPPFQEPSGCDAAHDKTLNMAGGGSLALEGVQYAPTDNIEIHGGSSGFGEVGQIIAWTIFYSGGTQINQEGPPNDRAGILHLDAACSGGNSPCSP